jgi:hypothetical protein
MPSTLVEYTSEMSDKEAVLQGMEPLNPEDLKVIEELAAWARASRGDPAFVAALE